MPISVDLRRACRRAVWVAGMLATPFAATVGLAQQQKAPVEAVPSPTPAKPPPSNPVGASSAWSTDGKSAPAGVALDPKQADLVRRVDAYFNDMKDLQGRFAQTTSDQKRSRGKFYIKRPAFFRFNYAPPSKLVILSDGEILAVEDHDLKTVDKYPIDSTPFRLIMRKTVDLGKDAQLVDVQETEDMAILTLADRSGKASGNIKLFFVKQPTFELKEWVVTDAQGVDTRIEVGDLDRASQIDPKIFQSSVSVFGNSN